MKAQTDLPFNPKTPTVMHLDLNSCFATIEQQANPLLRGKPIAVAAYPTPSGCILAPSIEAKTYGVKTGMRVKEGKLLCPHLTILSPDPQKYRFIHQKLKNLLLNYTDNPVPKSIDEFVLDLENYPSFKMGMQNVAKQIKQRIKAEIGEWLTISVGIGPNRFSAKTAASLHKPDGLDEINKDNFLQIYARLALTDLCGIKTRNAARLNSVGIHSVLDFYNSPIWKLKAAFRAITGYYWYLRLHGWEIDSAEFSRKSFGNSFALPAPLSTPQELSPILQKLTQKTGQRLRKSGFTAQGVHLSIVFRDGTWWHKQKTLPVTIFDSRDVYKNAYQVLFSSPYRKPVKELAVSCFNLKKKNFMQQDLFGEVDKKERLSNAQDLINQKWGDFVLTPARMLGMKNIILDRIAFGAVKDLV